MGNREILGRRERAIGVAQQDADQRATGECQVVPAISVEVGHRDGAGGGVGIEGRRLKGAIAIAEQDGHGARRHGGLAEHGEIGEAIAVEIAQREHPAGGQVDIERGLEGAIAIAERDPGDAAERAREEAGPGDIGAAIAVEVRGNHGDKTAVEVLDREGQPTLKRAIAVAEENAAGGSDIGDAVAIEIGDGGREIVEPVQKDLGGGAERTVTVAEQDDDVGD